MKKIILILSISAVVIMGLSAMALWGCCVYRETLAPLIIGGSIGEEMLANNVLPLASILYTVGMLGCMAGLCAVAGNLRVGVWADILLAAGMVLVVPGVRTLVTYTQRILMGSQGSAVLAAYASMETLASVALSLTGLATAAALLACGMSIALKKLKKVNP